MKILVTGYTPLQRATTHRLIQKIDVPAEIVAELRRQGHDVTWGPWTVGDDPSDAGFEAVFLCMNRSCSVASYSALHAIWLLGCSLPLSLFWDDWQTHAVRSDHRTFGRIGDRQIDKRWSTGKPFYSVPDESVLTREVRDRLIDTARSVGEGEARENWRANVYPRYLWGTGVRLLHRQGIKGLPHLTVDPSAKIELLPFDEAIRPKERLREWTLASIAPHDKWVARKIDPSWPVQYFGSMKLTKTAGAVRLKTELDVQREMSKRWGCLCPEYAGVASGWWRSRFIYSANLRTILIGDDKSAAILGAAHSVTASEVEELSARQLTMLGMEQARAVLPLVGTDETFTEEISAIVEAMKKGKRRGKGRRS